MQHHFHHTVAVGGEAALEVDDLAVARLDLVSRCELTHLPDEHVIMVRAIEDADHADTGQLLLDTLQEVVGELVGGGLLEGGQVHALGVDGADHVAHDSPAPAVSIACSTSKTRRVSPLLLAANSRSCSALRWSAPSASRCSARVVARRFAQPPAASRSERREVGAMLRAHDGREVTRVRRGRHLEVIKDRATPVVTDKDVRSQALGLRHKDYARIVQHREIAGEHARRARPLGTRGGEGAEVEDGMDDGAEVEDGTDDGESADETEAEDTSDDVGGVAVEYGIQE